MAFGLKSNPERTRSAPPSNQTPFVGFVNGKRVPGENHALVVGVSGAGKSRMVLSVGIAGWRGPVLAVSSKPDLVGLTGAIRAARGGPTYLLDLTGQVKKESLPVGVTRVISDPTALIRDDDDALDLASLLLRTGKAGGGDGKAGGGSGDMAFWDTLAAAPLAALLRAGGPLYDEDGDPLLDEDGNHVTGGGMPWVVRAAGKLMSPSAGDDDNSAEIPSWEAAYERVAPFSHHAESLMDISAADEKLADSVMVTIRGGLAPWQRRSVVGDGTAEAFRPEMLADPRATLYMVAPMTGVAAGAATAVVQQVITQWRDDQTSTSRLPKIGIWIDEVAHTVSGLPLEQIFAEARGFGASLTVAVQSTSQLQLRWNAEVVRDLAPSILLMYPSAGSGEKELFERAAWWSGRSDRLRESFDAHNKKSHSYDKDENHPAHTLVPRSRNVARLLRNGTSGDEVELVDIAKLVEQGYFG